MKLAGLVAAVSASPAAWITQNWWNEAVNVYEYASANPSAFGEAVNSAGDAAYGPLFSFCGGADGSVDASELTTCGAQIAGFVGMSDASQNYLYNFGAKYWNILDWDMSGSLDFQEFKWGMGALAATNALVVIDAYDSNADGLLSGSELTAWKSQFVSTASNWGWSVSDDKVSALKAAYAGAQVKT